MMMLIELLGSNMMRQAVPLIKPKAPQLGQVWNMQQLMLVDPIVAKGQELLINLMQIELL